MTAAHQSLADLLPGYELGAELGRGAWGIVYAATHRLLGRRVAVKVLPRAFGADPEARHRFLTEARLLATLEHPHVVPVFDYAEGSGWCVLVLEHLGGGSLAERMGTLPPAGVVATAAAVATGLDHAHGRGVLHRDVKPENVLFATGGRPKVADFGIAKVLDDTTSRATRVGDVLGTPAYMAPEQARGGELGPPTDLYALCVVTYEALAGRLPFAEDGDAMALLWRHVHEAPVPLADVAPTVPPSVAAVVMRGLVKEPVGRYTSGRALAAALVAAASEAWGPTWLDTCGVDVELPADVRRGGPRPAATLPPPAAGPARPAAATVVVDAIGPLRTPTAAEAAVLDLVRTGRLALDGAAPAELDALFHAAEPLSRLGLAPGSDVATAQAAAAAGAGRWRRRSDDPFADSTERGACETIARAYESIHHALASGV